MSEEIEEGMMDTRSALEDAFTQAEEKESGFEEGIVDDSLVADPESAESAESATNDEKPEKPGLKAESGQKEPEKGAKTDLEPDKAAPEGKAGPKAPAGWTPAAREHWDKLPEPVKAQVAKREKEAQQAMDNSSTARRAAQSLNQVLQPHQEGLRAAGHTDPFKLIGGLLQIESSLRVGNPTQKAETLVHLFNQYGVDLQALDTALSGQEVQASPNAEMERMIQERMAPVNQFLQQQQQQQEQYYQNERQNAATSLQEFSGEAEFLQDVRNDMADLLDMASKQNRAMSLQEAYTKACAIHPEISNVLAERARQQAVMGTQDTLQQKREASVSITGSQGGTGGKAGPQSLHDTIADAWDTQTG